METFVHHFRKFVTFFLRRFSVGAVDGGDTFCRHAAADELIGGEHALFHQFFGIPGDFGRQSFDTVVIFAAKYPDFRQRKIDEFFGTVAEAGHFAGKFGELLHARFYFTAPGAGSFAAVDKILYFVVVQTFFYGDKGVETAAGDHFAAGKVDLEIDAVRQ